MNNHKDEISLLNDKLNRLENKLLEQEHRSFKIITGIYKYGFSDDKDKRNSVWKGLIGFVVRRQLTTYVIAISTSILAIITLYLAYRSNEILNNQNDLISYQNKRIDQQIFLSEAERRSNYVFLLSDIIESVRLDHNEIGSNRLSQSTISTISAASLGFKPYRVMEGDTLSKLTSPERGQLLLYLSKLNLDEDIYDEIFRVTDFSYSEVTDAFLQYAYLRDAHLNYANFRGTLLTGADLSKADLKYTNFEYASIANVTFDNASMLGVNIDKSYAQIDFIDYIRSLHDPYRIKFATLIDKNDMDPLSMELFIGYGQILSDFKLDTIDFKYKAYTVSDNTVQYYSIGRK